MLQVPKNSGILPEQVEWDKLLHEYLLERRRLLYAEVAYIEKQLGMEQPVKKQLLDLRRFLDIKGIGLQNRGELVYELQGWIQSRLK